LLIGHYVPLLISSISWDHEEMTRDRIRRIWKQEERHHEDLRARMLQESIAWNNEKKLSAMQNAFVGKLMRKVVEIA